MHFLPLAAGLLLVSTHLLAQPRTLVEWRFDEDLQDWGRANHVTNLRVEDGAMQGTITDWDPFVTSPQFEIPATPWQRIEVRLRTDVDGTGLFYWTNTTDSPYGGFFPGKNTAYKLVGDNQWREYHVYPFWQAEEKIILLRLDLPRPPEEDYGNSTFAVEWIRIVDLGEPDHVTTEPQWDLTTGTHGWAPLEGGTVTTTPEGARFTSPDDAMGTIISGALRCPLEDQIWVAVEMSVDRGQAGYITWVSSGQSGLQRRKFPVIADGRLRTYNVDMSASREWTGEVLLLGIQPANEPGATATIRRIAITEDPQGGPQVECTYVGPENAINRVGPRIPLTMQFINRGGAPATDVRIAQVELPEGVTLLEEDNRRVLPHLEPFVPTDHLVHLLADRPARGTVRVTFEGEGAPPAAEGELVVLEQLNLPQADYVPEPQPLESDYEIGAFYFPRWHEWPFWEPILRHSPERKPVLGWYDESNPEIVDWQIKWAVENGISYFLVDWYWSDGTIRLEHWINAFKQARYRSHLKWAMMWANHNAPNTHSEDDQRKVTQYWIDNYFDTPEYYRIDDMPVVMIWSPQNMERDLADKGGAKRLLDISQEIAREAGYKGIYFVAMKWPEASTDPQIIQRLADMGFAMTSIYHYMHHGGNAADPTHFPFDLVADSSYDHWQAWHEAGILPFLPNLSTGWDSRPWHGDRATVIHGRTVPLFRRICEDAKRFADETGVTRMVLAPLNEWGEGSYLEPCKEFGFEMYETLREVFCKEPEDGWPLNYAPSDVGLGPYDLPVTTPERRTEWDFSDGAQGWGALMGVKSFRAEDGAIHFETTTRDPAIHLTLHNVLARDYPFVIVRMSLEGLEAEDRGQLFWSTATASVSEATSVRFDLIADGEYHDYVLPVGESNRWRGRIQTFRLDPCSYPDVKVSIESVRLSATAP